MFIKFTNSSPLNQLEQIFFFFFCDCTYRLSRPRTGAVDGVLADDTVWFVGRQPGHDHAARRGRDRLDASRWTGNCGETHGEHQGAGIQYMPPCAFSMLGVGRLLK